MHIKKWISHTKKSSTVTNAWFGRDEECDFKISNSHNIQKVHSLPLHVLDYLIINDSKIKFPRINKNFQQENSCHPGTL